MSKMMKTLLLRTKLAKGPPLSSLLISLRSQLQSLNRPDNPKAMVMTLDNLTVDEFKVMDWNALEPKLWPPLIREQLKTVKKRLSYKSRSLQHSILSAYRKKHEQRRVAREYKKLFDSMLNRFQQPIEEIWDGHERLESDPVKIHRALTKQFDSHHRQNPRTEEQHNWMAFKDHPEQFLNAPEFESVPIHLRSNFSKAITKILVII
jgi:hypothetical protein